MITASGQTCFGVTIYDWTLCGQDLLSAEETQQAVLLSLWSSATHAPPPECVDGNLQKSFVLEALTVHSETGIQEILFNMIHCDHVNVFHKRGLNYHTINHTIIRVNGLIVTQNLYFLMELITSVILDQEKNVRNIPYQNIGI